MESILKPYERGKDNLSEIIIKNNLKTSFIGKSIKIVNSVDSTNNWAKRELIDNDCNGGVFLAEVQQNGRGRLGSKWESECNKDILMSIVIYFERGHIPNYITLLVGLSVRRAINVLLSCDVSLKWPNDILINGKKVCGILCENVKKNTSDVLVVGIGINTNSDKFSDNIKDTATSLYLFTREKIQREYLISEVLNNLERYLKLNGHEIIEEYRKSCISIGKDVELCYRGQIIKGQVFDVSNNGELLIKYKENEIIRLNSINKVRQKL